MVENKQSPMYVKIIYSQLSRAKVLNNLHFVPVNLSLTCILGHLTTRVQLEVREFVLDCISTCAVLHRRIDLRSEQGICLSSKTRP